MTKKKESSLSTSALDHGSHMRLHEQIRGGSTGVVIGVQGDGKDALELLNCPICHTTLARKSSEGCSPFAVSLAHGFGAKRTRGRLIAMLLVSATLFPPTLAFADRVAQANVVFRDSCARCHSLDSLRATVAASAADEKMLSRSPRQTPRLSAWLKSPTSLLPETHCETARLDAVQRDLLESFLLRQRDQRANLRAELVTASRVEIVPKPKPVEPSLGQGNHR